MEIFKAKQTLRKEIAQQKKQHPKEQLLEWSHRILTSLEHLPCFRQAKCIALYEALPGEVQTGDFIRKWYGEKTILLPVVKGDDLDFLPYTGEESLANGAFGIKEPTANVGTSINEADLIVVPGIAFDRDLNRMGRGKGFYDRTLSSLDIPKIGICYGFQLFDHIPCEPFDIRMQYVLTESEEIGISESPSE